MMADYTKLQLLQHGSILQGPPFRHCSAQPRGWQFPQPSCPTTVPLHGLQLQPRLLLQVFPWAVPPSAFIHCSTRGSSVAACGDVLCAVSTGCRGTWGAAGYCSQSHPCSLLTKLCHINPLKISLKSRPHPYLEKLPGKLEIPSSNALIIYPPDTVLLSCGHTMDFDLSQFYTYPKRCRTQA